MRKFLALLIFGLFTCQAQAAIIYSDNGSTACASPSDTDYTVATRTCGSGAETVYDTILGGIGGLSSADILDIRAGTYDEEGITTATNDIPDGATNFAGATIIRGHAAETAIWKLTGSGEKAIRLDSDQWIIFKDFTIDGVNVTIDSQLFQIRHNADNIRIDNMIIKNSGGDGIFTFSNDSGQITNVEVINSEIFNCGLAPTIPRGVCIYWQVDNGLIDNNNIHNAFTSGIWCHEGDSSSPGVSNSNTISNNQVHDNTKTGIALGACANSRFYNNRIWDNVGGITMGSGRGGDENNKIYNNTIYNNNSAGVVVGIFGFTTGNEIINNIIDNNIGDGISVEANGDATKIENNVISNFPGNRLAVDDKGTNTTEVGTITSDPLMIDPVNDDFSIPISSPAKDQGTDLSSVFTVDYVGTTRPQGTSWDIGAFEFVETTPPPTGCGSPCKGLRVLRVGLY